ncbi:ArnT family glycosyltransferase [Chloroflexota bacterium]
MKLLDMIRKRENLIAWLLFAAFVLFAAQGISWGTPNIWHPDELIRRVLLALLGEWQFDEINFDYPSLPKYVMYGVGRLVTAAGYGKGEVILAARLVSALLGAAAVLLTYHLTRKVGGGPITALLAALLACFNPQLTLNARFAHNDIYLTFFVTLTAYALIQYLTKENRLWLYLAFLFVGMATSSKYNGVGLVPAPLVAYLMVQGKGIFKDLPRRAEELSIALGLLVAGYAIGTPKSVLWFTYYWKRAIPAIRNNALYGRGPGSVIGLVGQWNVMKGAFGAPLFYLIVAALLFWGGRTLWVYIKQRGQVEKPTKLVAALLLVALCYDIPIMVSYNLQPRFFTALVPTLAALVALGVEAGMAALKARQIAWGRNLALAGCAALVCFSFLQSMGIVLLFINDSRGAATEYLKTLPSGQSIEYTLYPPTVDKKQFFSAHNYPIFFINFPGQELPTSRHYTFNSGEEGIEERGPRYLAIDSFTYARFEKEHICELHPADCAFFEKLLAGKANYELLAAFEYDLPPYLPQVSLSFVNPDIRVYQRTGE